MKRDSCILAVILLLSVAATGCAEKEVPYGIEESLRLPGDRAQVWAVAPTLNLSGEPAVDPLLQSDLVFQQLQQVRGLTVIPVNRVVEVYEALRIGQVQSEEQAAVVCEALGCDGLIVPTVTIYDPFNPPKMGASLQLLRPTARRQMTGGIDPRQLARSSSPRLGDPLPTDTRLVQAAGMYDAANGSVRQDVAEYANGRHEPAGPLGVKEYFVNMDRFGGFVYHALIRQLLAKRSLEPAATVKG